VPTDLQNIQTIKSNTLALLATICDPVQAKLTYNVDGEMYSWTEYQAHLMARVEWCNAQLDAESPGDVVSRGETW